MAEGGGRLTAWLQLLETAVGCKVEILRTSSVYGSATVLELVMADVVRLKLAKEGIDITAYCFSCKLQQLLSLKVAIY